MQLYLLALGAAVLVAGCTTAGAPRGQVTASAVGPTGQICGRPYSSIEGLYAELRQDPDVYLVEQNAAYINLSNESELRTWDFTKPGHPAYPAALCRTLERFGPLYGVRTELACGNPGPGCDQMAADAAALEQRKLQSTQASGVFLP